MRRATDGTGRRSQLRTRGARPDRQPRPPANEAPTPTFSPRLRPPQWPMCTRSSSRCTRTDQEHVDRRGDRLLRRSHRPRSQADAGREAPDQPPRGVLRHRRLDRGQQSGAQPLPAHQRPRSLDVPEPSVLRRGAARPPPEPARQLHPRPRRASRRRSPPSRTFPRSRPRPTSASSGWATCRTGPADRGGPQAVPHEPHLLRHLYEGLFFFAAFAYVYFLRSKGLLNAPPPAPTGCSATSRCT